MIVRIRLLMYHVPRFVLSVDDRTYSVAPLPAALYQSLSNCDRATVPLFDAVRPESRLATTLHFCHQFSGVSGARPITQTVQITW